MANRAEWGERATGDTVTERSFLLRRGGGTAPAVLWSPAVPPAPRALPLVLLSHGGSGHKRNERLTRMGHWLAGVAGLAVIAIDGPFHGERVPEPMESAAYQQLIVDEGVEAVTARMTADWLA